MFQAYHKEINYDLSDNEDNEDNENNNKNNNNNFIDIWFIRETIEGDEMEKINFNNINFSKYQNDDKTDKNQIGLNIY